MQRGNNCGATCSGRCSPVGEFRAHPSARQRACSCPHRLSRVTTASAAASSTSSRALARPSRPPRATSRTGPPPAHPRNLAHPTAATTTTSATSRVRCHLPRARPPPPARPRVLPRPPPPLARPRVLPHPLPPPARPHAPYRRRQRTRATSRAHRRPPALARRLLYAFAHRPQPPRTRASLHTYSAATAASRSTLRTHREELRTSCRPPPAFAHCLPLAPPSLCTLPAASRKPHALWGTHFVYVV